MFEGGEGRGRGEGQRVSGKGEGVGEGEAACLMHLLVALSMNSRGGGSTQNQHGFRGRHLAFMRLRTYNSQTVTAPHCRIISLHSPTIIIPCYVFFVYGVEPDMQTLLGYSEELYPLRSCSYNPLRSPIYKRSSNDHTGLIGISVESVENSNKLQ